MSTPLTLTVEIVRGERDWEARAGTFAVVGYGATVGEAVQSLFDSLVIGGIQSAAEKREASDAM